jgi:hypothetical protein
MKIYGCCEYKTVPLHANATTPEANLSTRMKEMRDVLPGKMMDDPSMYVRQVRIKNRRLPGFLTYFIAS